MVFCDYSRFRYVVVDAEDAQELESAAITTARYCRFRGIIIVSAVKINKNVLPQGNYVHNEWWWSIFYIRISVCLKSEGVKKKELV